jgi:hypothetical protein
MNFFCEKKRSIKKKIILPQDFGPDSPLTQRVEIQRVLVQIKLVRFVIRLIRVKITLMYVEITSRVEITLVHLNIILCVYKSQSYVYKSYSCVLILHSGMCSWNSAWLRKTINILKNLYENVSFSRFSHFADRFKTCSKISRVVIFGSDDGCNATENITEPKTN